MGAVVTVTGDNVDRIIANRTPLTNELLHLGYAHAHGRTCHWQTAHTQRQSPTSLSLRNPAQTGVNVGLADHRLSFAQGGIVFVDQSIERSGSGMRPDGCIQSIDP